MVIVIKTGIINNILIIVIVILGMILLLSPLRYKNRKQFRSNSEEWPVDAHDRRGYLLHRTKRFVKCSLGLS